MGFPIIFIVYTPKRKAPILVLLSVALLLCPRSGLAAPLGSFAPLRAWKEIHRKLEVAGIWRFCGSVFKHALLALEVGAGCV